MSSLYCGIDLHSNNHVVVVIDENDQRLVEKRLPNNIENTERVLDQYKEHLKSVVIESTFNWYWLADQLIEKGYPVQLANPIACSRYSDIKFSDDRHDAFWLAHLSRLNILPTGHIHPKETRDLRDMLRRRLQMVHIRASHLVSVQNQIWRTTGVRISTGSIRRSSFTLDELTGINKQAAQCNLELFRLAQQQSMKLMRTVNKSVKKEPSYQLLRTIPGVGPILAMTILLESGDISRFHKAGNYASYCRCVPTARMSNFKRKGKGNAKAGNKYLSWAFAEAAHFTVRYDSLANSFFERKQAKTNKMVAIRAVAHKLARASYCMMSKQEPYRTEKVFC